MTNVIKLSTRVRPETPAVFTFSPAVQAASPGLPLSTDNLPSIKMFSDSLFFIYIYIYIYYLNISNFILIITFGGFFFPKKLK